MGVRDAEIQNHKDQVLLSVSIHVDMESILWLSYMATNGGNINNAKEKEGVTMKKIRGKH
jgi:hypothetical protein